MPACLRRHVCALILASSTSTFLPAQSPFSSPRGLLSTEGNKYGYVFGGFADGHFLYQEGDFRGAQMPLKAIAYRADYRNHTTDSGGRSWSNATLDLCESDMAASSSTPSRFRDFRVTTPTTVFSGSVTWPTLAGYPATRPASFSYRGLTPATQHGSEVSSGGGWEFAASSECGERRATRERGAAPRYD